MIRLRRIGLFLTVISTYCTPLGLLSSNLGIPGEGVVSEEDVKIINGGTMLSGTLLIPEGESPHPAIVLLHGSGDGVRSDYRLFADFFVAQGCATLFYDKRGSGGSGGSWLTASIQDLAEDALAGIEVLKQHPMIDKGRIGIWAISQGGWIASVLSSLTNDIAFTIVVTGGGAMPRESEAFGYQQRLSHEGFGSAAKAEAFQLLEQYFRYMDTGKERDKLEAAIDSVRNREWYNIMNIEKVLPSEERRENWSWVARYKPKEHIKGIRFPVLVLLGGKDMYAPLELTEKAWKAGLTEAGNQDFEIKIFPEAGHGITVGGHDPGHGVKRRYAEGYFDIMGAWLSARFLD